MTKRGPIEGELTPTMRAVFRRVPEEVLRRAIPISLLCVDRLVGIGDCVRLTSFIPGDTAEVGVAAGGTSLLIAASNRGRRHWACDTFEGLVDVGPHDGPLRNGMFARRKDGIGTGLARVTELLAGENAQVVAGKFPGSAPESMREVRFSFVHIDVDTYESMRACFAFFERRMSSGGLIALDDAVRGGAPGAQKFWRELVEGRRSGAWERFRETNQQAVVRFH
jgi:hypothetical protein